MIISTNDIVTVKTYILQANLIVKVICKLSRSFTTRSLSYVLNYDLYDFYANTISIYCNKGFTVENHSFSFFFVSSDCVWVAMKQLLGLRYGKIVICKDGTEVTAIFESSETISSLSTIGLTLSLVLSFDLEYTAKCFRFVFDSFCQFLFKVCLWDT